MIITCGSRAATVDAARENELEGLAYWQADLAYMIERDGGETPEARRTRENIEFCFRQLDALGVPFWLQNAALAFGRDWRRTKKASLLQWIQRREGWSVREGAALC